MNKRITFEQVINTAFGESTIVRTGTIIGESEVGMLRVEWDQDSLGKFGWVKPGSFQEAPVTDHTEAIIASVKKARGNRPFIVAVAK